MDGLCAHGSDDRRAGVVVLACFTAAALCAAGCGAEEDDGGGRGQAPAGGGQTGTGGLGGTGGGFSNSDGTGGVLGTDGGTFPVGGGSGSDFGNGTDCDTQLLITVRDLTEAHPDFESYNGSLKGIVAIDLGADNTPVYALPGPSPVTTGAAEFAQWYHDTPGVNVRVPGVGIQFTESSPGVYVFESDAFFPIDGMGLGDGPSLVPGLIPADHNYLFTTEVHTLFTYKGGENFTFTGDDDLWIFVNGKLGIDLGGVHGSESETLDMDAQAAALGLTVGETYPMDIFHAERHTTGSNFRIETTIDFSCIVNIPPVE